MNILSLKQLQEPKEIICMIRKQLVQSNLKKQSGKTRRIKNKRESSKIRLFQYKLNDNNTFLDQQMRQFELLFNNAEYLNLRHIQIQQDKCYLTTNIVVDKKSKKNYKIKQKLQVSQKGAYND